MCLIVGFERLRHFGGIIPAGSSLQTLHESHDFGIFTSLSGPTSSALSLLYQIHFFIEDNILFGNLVLMFAIVKLQNTTGWVSGTGNVFCSCI